MKKNVKRKYYHNLNLMFQINRIFHKGLEIQIETKISVNFLIFKYLFLYFYCVGGIIHLSLLSTEICVVCKEKIIAALECDRKFKTY